MHVVVVHVCSTSALFFAQRAAMFSCVRMHVRRVCFHWMLCNRRSRFFPPQTAAICPARHVFISWFHFPLRAGRFTCAFCTRLNLFIAFIISCSALAEREREDVPTLKWKIQDNIRGVRHTGAALCSLWLWDKIYFSSSFSTFFYPPLYFLFAPLGSLSLFLRSPLSI
jgi:hypothetical protein